MTRRTKRKLVFRGLLVVAALLGLARGWMQGVQASQSTNRAEGFTVRIDSEEIGVRLDTLTGELEVLGSAGYHWVVPGLSEVFRISRAPVTVVLGKEGGRPGLSVRSADGSVFLIDEARLTYRVAEGGALTFLADSGTEPRRAADWVASLARPILREELGSHTIQEMTDALVVDAARSRVVDRLAGELIGHGIELVGVTVSKPTFDRNYEIAIKQRKVADQDVVTLEEKKELKLREREERIAKTIAETKSRDAMLDGEIEQERIGAQTNAEKTRNAADVWAVGRRAEALSYAEELEAKAATLQAQGEATVALFEAELAALAERGDMAIRERWIANLAKTTFHLTPIRIEPEVEAGLVAGDILGGKP